MMCPPMKVTDFEASVANLFVVSGEISAPMKMSFLWLTPLFKRLFQIGKMFG